MSAAPPFDKTSPEALAYLENPDRLHNDRTPFYELQRESPVHRLMVFLKARGFSNREIAKQTEYTTVAISNILRQPWAREKVLAEIRTLAEAGDEAFHLLRNEVLNNLHTLVDVRDDIESSRSDRARAANDLLDRVWGKPTQKIESTSTRIDLSTVEALDREEARLAAEESRLLGKPNN